MTDYSWQSNPWVWAISFKRVEQSDAPAKPILFGGPMVRVILEDRKTQTRRVVKGSTEHDGPYNPAYLEVHKNAPGWKQICPYGKPGDRLWVRETFQPIFADGFEHGHGPSPDWKTGYGYAPRYIATEGRTEWLDGDDEITDRCKPAIFMPRWASRITLELTDVRVQRVQEISEMDAIAEGCESDEDMDAEIQFAHLWDSINGKRKGKAAK